MPEELVAETMTSERPRCPRLQFPGDLVAIAAMTLFCAWEIA
jgi:hypothetical protein